MKKEELNTETAQQAPPIKKRLLSLDALRGITVAGMILVNNAGGKVSYAPLQHSAWNGLTLCDLVFPFFLFIMGISTYISLNARTINSGGGSILQNFHGFYDIGIDINICPIGHSVYNNQRSIRSVQ